MVNLWLLRLVTGVSRCKSFNIAVTLAVLSYLWHANLTCKPSSMSLDLFQFVTILCSMRGPSSGSIFHHWMYKSGVTCSLDLLRTGMNSPAVLEIKNLVLLAFLAVTSVWKLQDSCANSSQGTKIVLLAMSTFFNCASACVVMREIVWQVDLQVCGCLWHR